MELEMSGLHESASLFEVNIPDYKQLKACRREVVYLRTLHSPSIPTYSFKNGEACLGC